MRYLATRKFLWNPIIRSLQNPNQFVIVSFATIQSGLTPSTIKIYLYHIPYVKHLLNIYHTSGTVLSTVATVMLLIIVNIYWTLKMFRLCPNSFHAVSQSSQDPHRLVKLLFPFIDKRMEAQRSKVIDLRSHSKCGDSITPPSSYPLLHHIQGS